MKKTAALLFTAALIFSAESLSALSFFSGETGLSANMANTKTKGYWDPSLCLDGFFSGQLNLGKNFTLRGEFSFKTEDIYEKGILHDVDSIFSLNEVSLNYIKAFGGFTHSLSIFAGTFEPVGSGQLLQRQFGVKPHQSKITEGWRGVRSGNVYDYFGYGAAYTVRTGFLPICAGLLACQNDKHLGDSDQFNGDFRLGTAFKYLSLDGGVGVSFPYENEDSAGNKCVIYIPAAYMHAGADVLLGSKDFVSVFGQFGIDYYPLWESDSLPESKKIEADVEDFYIFVEPRITCEGITLCTSVFNIPASKINDMILIDNPTGISQTVEFNKLNIFGNEIALGIHGMISFQGKTIKDLKYIFNDFKDELDDYKNIKFCPYIKANFKTSELNVMFQADLTKIEDKTAGGYQINLGYKAKF